MWDWTTRGPQYCLKIGAHDLAWAEVHRNWRGRPRYQCVVSALPEGVMRLSPLEPNIALPHELETHIRAIVGSAASQASDRSSVVGVPRAATVILPDLAVRLAVLRLQDLPWSSEEREALVRWRLGQEQLLSLNGAKVFSQVLSDSSGSGDGPCTVLAVVAQEAVLAQYEAVCEAAGLIPQEVDVSSLRLFNLWAQELLKTGQLTSDFLWVNATDGGVTAFIFHQGTLVFLRSKLQAGLGTGGAWLPGSEQACLDRIVQECADSIYACQQQTPDLAISQAILIADELMGPGLQQQLQRGLGVPVKGLDWEQIQQYGGGTIVGPQTSAALPAIAGVV
jgi:type IV pilus assembly protein PilM